MQKNTKLALIQMDVEKDKTKNIDKALTMIENAVKNGAEVVILPEMFNCPYDIEFFSEYSEYEDKGQTVRSLSQKAQELDICIFGGSIPERDGEKIYNTCFVFSREGKVIAKHRKVHLFDIDVKGKITFKESDVLSEGDRATVTETGFFKAGIGICYDIRFPELSRIMTLQGAEALIFPGAFNMVTGPAHWEILVRTRALDNQVYLAACAPARKISSLYISYGNSMVSDPWGNIIARANESEQIIFADIEKDVLKRIRTQMPLLKHRRSDIYL